MGLNSSPRGPDSMPSCSIQTGRLPPAGPDLEIRRCLSNPGPYHQRRDLSGHDAMSCSNRPLPYRERHRPCLGGGTVLRRRTIDGRELGVGKASARMDPWAVGRRTESSSPVPNAARRVDRV